MTPFTKIPKQIEEVINAEVKQIEIADDASAPDIEAGIREAVPPPLAQAAGEIVPAPHDSSVREVPAVIRLEQYTDGQTTEKLEGVVSLSR